MISARTGYGDGARGRFGGEASRGYLEVRWIVLAAVVQFIVYLIPHRVLGSELDYTKMSG